MNLPPGMADWLRSQGHAAIHALSAGLSTLPDKEIFAYAQAEERIVRRAPNRGDDHR
jgi:predicted nuclease of predicted toxin-antitoxin system